MGSDERELHLCHLEKARWCGGERADLILWPEASTPWAVRGDEQVRARVEALVASAKAPLLLGSIVIEHRDQPDEAWYNGMLVVTPDLGLQTAYYAKRHLVPFGEYVPLRFLFGWLNSSSRRR